MKKINQILNILMNGILIGTLEKTKQGSLLSTYDQGWLNTSGACPISLYGSCGRTDKKWDFRTKRSIRLIIKQCLRNKANSYHGFHGGFGVV